VPIKQFMTIAVACVMLTSVTFLGNAVHALQAGDLISYHRLDNWPRIPIFLSQVTGYWPTLQSVVAQIALLTVYLLGALYAFVLRPRRHRADTPTTPSEPSTSSTLVNA
jgi:high-affinity iron transporter